MSDIGYHESIVGFEKAVICYIGGYIDIGLCGFGVGDEVGSAASTQRNALHRMSEQWRMFYGRSAKRVFEALQKFCFVHAFGQIAYHAQSGGLPSVIQRNEVESRFFVRMRTQQGRYDGRLPECWQHDLQACSGFGVQLAYSATKRVRVGTGSECAQTIGGITASVVMADVSGTGGKLCCAHLFEGRRRHECGQFQQLMLLRYEYLQILQSEFFGHFETDASQNAVHAGVCCVDGDVVFDGCHNAAFDFVASSD